ncbi:MAG: hypothetical protein ABJM43_12525 [Paracoccaceae bacterium]
MFVGSERGGNSVAIKQTAARVMHDYHYIRVARNNYRRLTPVQTAAIHLDQERQDRALVVMRLGHDITISAFSVLKKAALLGRRFFVIV